MRRRTEESAFVLVDMPRYFFNFSGDVSRDDVGVELRDSETAFIEAVKGARSCMADQVRRGSLPLSDEVEVSDHDGRVLFVIPFREVVASD